LPTCLVTCEHASNHVPARWRKLFPDTGYLDTHAGYDIGAQEMARTLTALLGAPLHAGKVSRLLVDLNRSLHHPRVFAPPIKALSQQERALIVAHYYEPYRNAVAATINAMSRRTQVLHLSVHSFTPRWHGRRRPVDIGLLYDPARQQEAEYCSAVKANLKRLLPSLRIRRNFPYRGNTDGLTTSLRRRYPMHRYLGIELEFNQDLLRGPAAGRRALAKAVAAALYETRLNN